MMLNKSIDDSIEYIMMLCWGRCRDIDSSNYIGNRY